LKIVEQKMAGKGQKNFAAAVDAFIEIRKKKNINKPPATSELIDLIKCLDDKGLLKKDVDLKKEKKVADTLGAIAKSKADLDILKKDFIA
jgi:hypothetical protein